MFLSGLQSAGLNPLKGGEDGGDCCCNCNCLGGEDGCGGGDIPSSILKPGFLESFLMSSLV